MILKIKRNSRVIDSYEDVIDFFVNIDTISTIVQFTYKHNGGVIRLNNSYAYNRNEEQVEVRTAFGQLSVNFKHIKY